MYSWKLPSNDGWNMTSWKVRETFLKEQEQLLLVEVTFTGSFWERHKSTCGKFEAYRTSEDYTLILPQLFLREKALKELYDQLRQWLQTPISELLYTPLETAKELSGIDDQIFNIFFDIAPEYIVKTYHPFCRIFYECSRFAGECNYITDQSCIQIFVDDIAKYLDREKEV